jgi:hypothetical protein
VNQVLRAESTRLRADSKPAAQRLKYMRLTLLRRGSRARGRARQKLEALLTSKLATARAWDLKETFHYFWQLQIGQLGGRFPRLLVLPGDAESSGADEKGGSHVACTRAADLELVPRQRRDLHRRSRGREQQNPSGYQTILRLPHLPCYGNGSLSHVRTTSGTKIPAQILLRRPI